MKGPEEEKAKAPLLHSGGNKEMEFLMQLEKAVETHLGSQDFSIPDLCSEMGLSRSQIHRKLKKLTGVSTSAYIRSIRMQKAIELLLDSTLPISEIAFKVGFRDPSYFTRLFTKMYGVPPGEYRKGGGE
ncbi:MAG: helix-turn-helix transcriptional regulator [Phaeodactylibacter sp.]|nr:helix-turn-helix transcriptional regulator [Phaeodactylibacter sp.]